MRKKNQASDSFELFLDTICNTFGGIVFLAILLAIMIQTRSIVSTEQPDDRNASPDQVREAVSELESLAREQQELQQAISTLPEPNVNPKDIELADLIEEAQAAEKIAAETMQRQLAKSRELGMLLASNGALEQENEEVPKVVKSAKAKVDEQEESLKQIIASKEQPIQIARVRASGAASVLLLVSDHQVYLARKPSLFGQGFNEDHVSTAIQADSGIQVIAKTGKGWSRNSAEGRAEFRDVIQSARREGMTLTLAIWPGSYQDFADLRQEMVDANVFFQLWPQAETETLTVYIGGGGSSFVQ
jgi:hypothetical protein